MSNKEVPMVMLSAMILFASPALAQSSTHAMSAAEHSGRVEHENKAELNEFNSAKVSMLDAISAAEKEANGKAYSVSFESRNGKPDYKVKTYQNNGIWLGMVDATSGQVSGTGKTIQQGRLDKEDRVEVKGIQNAQKTLTDAVKAAEQHASGKAIDAALTDTKGKLAYEVEVVKNSAVQKVMVDPSSGKVTSG